MLGHTYIQQTKQGRRFWGLMAVVVIMGFITLYHHVLTNARQEFHQIIVPKYNQEISRIFIPQYNRDIMSEEWRYNNISLSPSTGNINTDNAAIQLEDVQETPRGSRKQTKTALSHSSGSALTSCQVTDSRIIEQSLVRQENMTVNVCKKFCAEAMYAVLFRGDNCFCTSVHGTKELVKDSECNLKCAGNSSQLCGGPTHWMFHQLRRADGVNSWSIWMTQTASVSARYRGCHLNQFNECQVETETRGINSQQDNHFVGCFTDESWLQNYTQLSFGSQRHHGTSAAHCLQSCKEASQSPYAVWSVTGKHCFCSESLGWSRPLNTCQHGVGALVFMVERLNNSSAVRLKFEPKRKTRMIAQIAHYRGGSTLASTLLSSYPNTMHVFEPASIFNTIWLDVTKSYISEHERTHLFLQKIYPLWFRCQATDLPGVWLARYPKWTAFNAGLESFSNCVSRIKSRMKNIAYIPAWCSPYIEERCHMSDIISSKTIRIKNIDELELFASQNPDIDLVHIIRDPRGIVASRRNIELSPREKLNNKHRPPVRVALPRICGEMIQLHNFFEGDKRTPNLHVVHYEDLAKNLISAAKKFYASLSIPYSGHVDSKSKQFMTRPRKDTAYGVSKSDPQKHINSWMRNLKHDDVFSADSSVACQQFFKLYPSYYKPMEALS